MIERTKAGLATEEGRAARAASGVAVLLTAAAELVRAGTPICTAARAKSVKESTCAGTSPCAWRDMAPDTPR